VSRSTVLDVPATRMPHSKPPSQLKDQPLLEARALCIWRGETQLFDSLSLELHARDILWLRGPNGSGKTSLLRVLTGLSEAEWGEVLWEGQALSQVRDRLYADLAWLGHQPGVRGELSPRENLWSWRPLAGQDSGMSVESALTEVGLDGRMDQPCQTLSAGQNRRVAMARLLLCHARLWCLDEPLTSLDADGQALLGRLMARHREQGGAILVSSHQSLPDILGDTREYGIGGGAAA